MATRAPVRDSLAIGIHVPEPATPGPVALTRLPDALADRAQLVMVTGEAIAGVLAGLLQRQRVDAAILTSAPCAPAAFNRFISAVRADVYVWLEVGVMLAPGCLERLLAALRADPSYGLAGPSTNRHWNEQGVAIECETPGNADALAGSGAEVYARFGDGLRTLSPLHSLGDFCYAVRRDVVDRIGLADEGYGAGPCWEMDYNIRAARAGFVGVWVAGAYAFRAPVSAARLRLEAELFERSRRRYQDKFCGRRLRAQRLDYAAHCRGEDCRDFAPSELIALRIPASSAAPGAQRLSVAPPPDAALSTPTSLEPTSPDRRSLEPAPMSLPLVSCIMPTRDRRPFVRRAITAFLRQDYPARELIILDDGIDAVADLVPDDPRIRYERRPPRMSIGAKRNACCELAQGSLIAHWDDDDWSAPQRLSRQVAALQDDVIASGLDQLYFCDPDARRAWLYRYPGGRDGWVAGGTLCYRHAFWQLHRFVDLDIGEDSCFVRGLADWQVAKLDEPGLYVARVHAGNTSRKLVEDPCYTPQPLARVQAVMGDAFEYHFPAPRLEVLAPADAPIRVGRAGVPLVSCIMPTANRRAFVPLAIEFFQAQTHPLRELIIVDDGADAIEDLVPSDANIRYIRTAPRSVGDKRNLACERARGEFIVHWDDDDWHHPKRLELQLRPLLEDQADVVALPMYHVLDLAALALRRCNEAQHARIHYRDLCPGTIAYRRALFDTARYPPRDCAEDVGFLMALPATARVYRLDSPLLFVCVRHGRNTWQIGSDWHSEPAGWCEADPALLPAEAWATYAALHAQLHGGYSGRTPATTPLLAGNVAGGGG